MTMLDRLRQFVCQLRGHDPVLQFEPSRLFLRCLSCGHETPGWIQDMKAPVVTRDNVVRFRQRLRSAS